MLLRRCRCPFCRAERAAPVVGWVGLVVLALLAAAAIGASPLIVEAIRVAVGG